MSALEQLPAELAGMFSRRDGTVSVFTFRLEGMSYAVLTSRVHSVVQDKGGIRSVPFSTQGLMGITNYSGRPVAIFDFAHRLGCRSGREHKEEVLGNLQEQEQEHGRWVKALEAAIRDGEPFLKERDPQRCAFGRWLAEFEPHDEALAEILSRAVRPHERIHAMAMELMDKAAAGQQAEAMEVLESHGQPLLTRFGGLCREAMNHLQVISRSVILYLTEDGEAPVLGLRIDEVDDMVRFRPEHLFPPDRVGVPIREELRPLVLGYLSNGKSADAILIDPVRDLENTARMVGQLGAVAQDG